MSKSFVWFPRTVIVLYVFGCLCEDQFGKNASVSLANTAGSSLQSVISDVTEGVLACVMFDEQKKKKVAEKAFWELNTPEMTEDVKRELEILSMRGYWDPKSFFKVMCCE